jgi:uncharacterized protein YidB (DUF937 family)
MIDVMRQWFRFPAPLWGHSTSEEFSDAVEDLVRRYGGVSMLVGRMDRLGLGAVARSWLSNGARLPIYSEHLHTLFGTSVLRAMAAKLDRQPRDLVRQLSEALPRAMYRLAQRSTAAQ